jgi:hypothetical protein
MMTKTTTAGVLEQIVVGSWVNVVAVISLLFVVGSDAVCCLVSETETVNAGRGRTLDGPGMTTGSEQQC